MGFYSRSCNMPTCETLSKKVFKEWLYNFWGVGETKPRWLTQLITPIQKHGLPWTSIAGSSHLVTLSWRECWYVLGGVLGCRGAAESCRVTPRVTRLTLGVALVSGIMQRRTADQLKTSCSFTVAVLVSAWFIWPAPRLQFISSGPAAHCKLLFTSTHFFNNDPSLQQI